MFFRFLQEGFYLRRHFPFWLMLLSGCVMAPFLALGWVCRPFWSVALSVLIWVDDKERAKAAQKGCAFKSSNPRLLLAIERRSRWTLVLPLLDAVENKTEKARFACGFATLYLWNGRLKEAHEAAKFWACIPAQWVSEHPDDARDALVIRASDWTWHPHSMRLARQRDNSTSTSSKEQEEFGKMMKTLHEAGALDHGMVTHWRNSRLAVAMLKWIDHKITEGEVRWPLEAHRGEKRPLWLPSTAFTDQLAERIGMTDEIFDPIWHQATKLDV